METQKAKEKECYYIICVDDDDTFLDQLSRILSDKLSKHCPEFNYKFKWLENTDDLLPLINDLINKNEQVAIIICDQLMPKISGIELFEEVIKDFPDIMRVLLTCYEDLEWAKRAINSHLLDQYITKPIDDYENFISIINHLTKKFHLQRLKTKQEEKLKMQNKALKAEKSKTRRLLRAAEDVAFFSKEIKKLDINEILDLIIGKIPNLFNCNKVSLFILHKEDNIYKLCLERSTHIKDKKIELILDRETFLPIKDIVKDLSNKVIEERWLNKRPFTPIQKAIKKDSIVVISNIEKSELRLLGKEKLGKSCIVIPFIIRAGTEAAEKFSKDLVGEVNVGGMMSLSGIEINKEAFRLIKYKASLVRDILGTNITNAKIYSETKKMAITDSLTGLYNNRMLNEFLNKELERTKRYYNIFSVVVCDIDNFKRINDKHGHLTGDMVLQQLANLLASIKRDSDILFRYGGEEFVFILPETSGELAYYLIERIRQGVEKAKFSDRIFDSLTLSFGISQCSFSDKKETAKGILGRADMAMYAAKAKGKNRVEIFTPEKD